MKDRMPDTAFEHRAIRKPPFRGDRRFDEKPEFRTAGLLLRRMAQKKERSLGGLGAKTEPPAFRQAELCPVAADFQNGRRKRAAGKRCFHQPQNILQPPRQAMQNSVRTEPELRKPGRIWGAHIVSRHHIADPQNRCTIPGQGFQMRRQRCGKAACRRRIGHPLGPHLGDPVDGKPAGKRPVEGVHAEGKPIRFFIGNGSICGLCHGQMNPRCSLCLFKRGSSRKRLSLQSGDLFTQAKIVSCALAFPAMASAPCQIVHFMFLWIPESRKRVNGKSRGIFSSPHSLMILFSKIFPQGIIWAE